MKMFIRKPRPHKKFGWAGLWKQLAGVLAMVSCLLAGSTGSEAPKSLKKPQPLVFIGGIPLAKVEGRIDHMAFDPKGRLFISALGNDSEEVIDLSRGMRVHSITGIKKPQGVAYSPETNKLFVGSDEGKLYIYDGSSFEQIAALDFGDDVDNLRYDAANKKLYVGFGDDQEGAIGVVDVQTGARNDEVYKLGAHPESFQLEYLGPNIYVNLPALNQIAAINRKTGKISRWKVPFESNFPMALDESRHRVFVATREPARMAVFDTNSGKMIAALPCVQNSDDIYYDSARKRIYVPGGEGHISVFQQNGADSYALVAKIPSAVGGRTANYPGKGRKGLDSFYVAVPARADEGAEVRIYTVQD